MKKILLILSSTIFLNSCWGEPFCVLSDSSSDYCSRVYKRKYPSRTKVVEPTRFTTKEELLKGCELLIDPEDCKKTIESSFKK